MHTFKKNERLCNKSTINKLFLNGNNLSCYPLSAKWLLEPKNNEYSVRVLFAVSKKSFKQSVKRNYIKRLLRENYRKSKSILYANLIEHNISLNLSISYIGKTIPNYHAINKSLIDLFNALNEDIKQKTTSENESA